MVQTISKNKTKKLLDNVYLVLFAAMIGYSFLLTTTFEIVWPEYLYENLRILLLVVIMLKTAVEEKADYTDLFLGAFAAVVFLIAWKHNDYEILSNVILLIVGCRGIPFRKIVKTYLLTCSVLLIITMAFALTGRIENFVLQQEGRRLRIAFGVIYPTDFSAHVFYMIIAYCYLRKEKIKYIEIGAIAALGIFVYVFCDARLNAVCILLTAGIVTYNKLRHKNAAQAQKKYEMNSVFSAILCFSTTIFSIMMIGMTLLYSPNNKWMVLLDRLLNNRLKLGKKGIDLYGLSVFGQQIYLIGNGNHITQPKNYFFLDSSYLFVLLQYGILVLGVLLVLFMAMGLRARKEQDWLLLWLIALMSLQCVVEHHIMDISFNILLWGTLAYLGKERQTVQSIKQKKSPVLIGLALIAILMGGLLFQKYWAQSQAGESTIIPEDLAREGTIEQFQNPEDLIEYTVAALGNQDMDLVLRACAIDERLLANPFVSTLNEEEKFGYDMVLPPSAEYEEYRPLSSAELTRYYIDQYYNFQEQSKDLSGVKLKKVGVFYPQTQLSSGSLFETAQLCDEWGADGAIQLAALLEADQGDYMLSFTVIKYYGYWKIFDFAAELAEQSEGQLIKTIEPREFDSVIRGADVLSFAEKLDDRMSDKTGNTEKDDKIEDIKNPEDEILPPNYYIAGASYGKEQKDTIQKFLLAIQKKDAAKALSYCNIDHQADNLNAVSPEIIHIQAHYAKQISYLYYGLLGETYFQGEQALDELGETAGEILERLNPELIPYMDIMEILKVEDHQYIVFYAFNGRCYISGYTLVKQNEGWQIDSLSAPEEKLEAGEVREISWEKYNQWTGNK